MRALFALALLLPLSAHSETADAFVRTVYTEHYKNQGFGADDLPKRRAWFTPRLYALLAADAKREPESADPPRLAFDPFTHAQEDADRFEIGAPRQEGGRAFVPVENYYGKDRLRVTLQLVELGGAWRIENIHYSRRFNLRRILSTPP